MKKDPTQEKVYDRDGKVVRSSHNLDGFLRHVRLHRVGRVWVRRLPGGEGRLRVDFVNGDTYDTRFADYAVLCEWVVARRALRGVALAVGPGAEPVGPLGHNETFLRLSCRPGTGRGRRGTGKGTT